MGVPISSISDANRDFSIEISKGERLDIFLCDNSISFGPNSIRMPDIQVFILEILFDTQTTISISDIANELDKSEKVIKKQLDLIYSKLDLKLGAYLQSKISTSVESNNVTNLVDETAQNFVLIHDNPESELILGEDNYIEFGNIKVPFDDLEYKLMNKLINAPACSWLPAGNKRVKINNGRNISYQDNPDFFHKSLKDTINKKLKSNGIPFEVVFTLGFILKPLA